MNVWVAFVIYEIYRIFRLFVHLVQYSFGNDRSTSTAEDCDEDCEVMSILYRHKLAEDMTSANDFIWWHEKFVKAKDALASDPCWTLYTLDHQYAYFVRTPKPWPDYHAREAPFVFMRQYEVATKLARMPFNAFCRFAKEHLPEPKGPVVYYSSASRSGSTLLTRVMQVSEERIRCFSEPDAFTALTIFQQRGFINDRLAEDLLKAIFKYYCKTQEPGQTYLFKPMSNGARIVPMIKKAMPKVKHMFSFRRSTRRILSSLEKVNRKGAAGDVWVVLWNVWPEFVSQEIAASAYEYELFKKFGVDDVLDTAIISHVASYYYYYRCRDLFDIPMISYEDLIADKEKTLRPIFDICELPFDESIGQALEGFNTDSQVGTALCRDSMKKVKDTPLDQSKIMKIHKICDQLSIPRFFQL